MKKRIVKICILTSFLILALIVWKNVYMKKNSFHNGNLSNYGMAVEDKNGNIFFNKYGEGIYCLNGENEIKLVNEKNVYSLNIVNDKLYYLSVEEFSKIIIKSINTDGSNHSIVTSISTPITKIFVDSKYIYYVNNKEYTGITKIYLSNGREEKIIEEDIRDFQVNFSNKKIYYINRENQICYCNLLGEKSKILNNDAKANKLQIVDNYIYYFDINENALFRLGENGKNKALVSTLVKNDIYNISDKYVYYYDKNEQSIKRMDIINSINIKEITKVSTLKPVINLTNDKVFYLDKGEKDSQIYQLYVVELNEK